MQYPPLTTPPRVAVGTDLCHRSTATRTLQRSKESDKSKSTNSNSSFVTTADCTVSAEEACRRYEALLAQLTRQALAQQQEIASLTAQLQRQQNKKKQAASQRTAKLSFRKERNTKNTPGGQHNDDGGGSSAVYHESLHDIVERVAAAVAEEYLHASDTYLAECVARRLRRITRGHVQRSLDNAIAEMLPVSGPANSMQEQHTEETQLTMKDREKEDEANTFADPNVTPSVQRDTRRNNVSGASLSSLDVSSITGDRVSSHATLGASEVSTITSADTIPSSLGMAAHTMGRIEEDSRTFSRNHNHTNGSRGAHHRSRFASVTESATHTASTDEDDDAMHYLLSVFSGHGSRSSSSRTRLSRNAASPGQKGVHLCDSSIAGVTHDGGGNSSSAVALLSSSAASGASRVSDRAPGIIPPATRPPSAATATASVQRGPADDVESLLLIFAQRTLTHA